MGMARNRKTKQTEEIQGVFAGERFVFQEGTPGRTIIGCLDDGRTVKGEAKQNELQSGVLYRFDGNWNQHPKYGRQFLFHSFCQPAPTTREALIGYLATCPHIGTLRAERIVDAFGDDTLNVLKTDPDRVAKDISGLSISMCNEIRESLLTRESQESYTIEINKLLSGHGIPKKVYNKIFEDYGTAAPDVVRKNPYILMDYKGVGFLKSDEIYLRLGNDPKSVDRQMWYAYWLLTTEQQGSTIMLVKEIQQTIYREIGDDDDCGFERAIEKGIEKGIFLLWKKQYLCLYPSHISEHAIADFVNDSDSRPNLWPDSIAENEQNKPSDHQKAAFLEATKKPLGLLIGAPGTGKTWLVARIIDAIKATGKTLAVAAPTNKAANRMSETFRDQEIDLKANTIHSLLMAEIEDGAFKFRYNATNKLPCDFVIIDESSMIDSRLMASLLDALTDETNILFVGDPDQLSPVGRGAPLRDMIASGIPCGKLSEIRRNAGSIVVACRDIKGKTMFNCHAKDVDDAENNLVLLRYNANDPVATIRDIIDYESKWESEFRPVIDTQVLVATNEKSPVSRKALNEQLRIFFSKNMEIKNTKGFIEGDKVICLANGNANLACDRGQVRVANGDIGFVENEMKESYHIEINNQMVVVPKNFDQWGAYDFDFGYAITVHKSQGSQWPVIIIALDSSFAGGMVCDRHWIYTAISRAVRRCYILGNESQIQGMIRKSNMWNRKTMLETVIKEIRWKHINSKWEMAVSNG